MNLKTIDKLSDFISIENQYHYEDFNIFFSDEYKNYITSSTECYKLFYNSILIIPVIIKKHFIFKYAEFISEPAKLIPSNIDIKQYSLFIDSVCDELKTTYKIDWINQPSSATLFAAPPSHSKSIPFGSHVIDLTLSEGEIFSKIHSKHRNAIKKGEKDGVRVVVGGLELISDYYSIDKETWARSNKTAYSQQQYESLLGHLNKYSKVFISYYNNQPQTGAIILYNRQMAYYLYGASITRPHTGAGNLLQWHVIKTMKGLNVMKYSFVGCRINADENSKYYNIQRFKERFGGDLMSVTLFKVIYKPLKYYLYKIIVSAILSIKGEKIVIAKDIIDQEYEKWNG